VAGIKVPEEFVDEDPGEGRNERDEHRQLTRDLRRTRGDESENCRDGQAGCGVGEPQRLERAGHAGGQLHCR